MKFVLALASLIALAVAGKPPVVESSTSDKKCIVGKNGIQAHYVGGAEKCRCPAEFRHNEKQGCLRICTLGKNGVQASFKGLDSKGKDICVCPKHFAYSKKEGCQRTSESTPKQSQTTHQTKHESTKETRKESTKETKKESTKEQKTPYNPCNQKGQAHADFSWGKCVCPAEFDYNDKKGCLRICTWTHQVWQPQAGFQGRYEKGKPVCVCPPPFKYIHGEGCIKPKISSSSTLSD